MPSMLQWVLLLLLTGVSLVGCMPRGGAGPSDGAPSNITVMFLSHTSVHVNWSVNMDNVEKYDVTYKPTDASFKVVIVVAGNSESVVLDQLMPDTQYQMWVQAFRAGRRFRSRQIVFRTLADPDAPQVTGVPFLGAPRPAGVGGAGGSNPASPGQGGSSKANKSPVIPPNPPVPQDFIQVRGVEVGIVLLVLLVWVGAIVLFFNRWGKIRMLLPYQPDYKEQLKVPGTGACGGASGAPCAGQHATSCSQCAPHKCPSFPVCHNFHHLHWPAHCSADDADESWLRTRSSIQIHRPLAPLVRSRVNSAIYISAECQHAAAAAAAGQRGVAAGVSGSSGGYAGSARTLAASLLASGLARPWARRARSAENIPLHTAGGGGGGASADDDEDDLEDEEAAAGAKSRKRHVRRGHFEMPVLSVSGPSPPGDGDGEVELEQHL